MCGLVGMIGDFVANDHKAFKWLLIYDTIRGEHSTGVASIGRKNNEIVLAKEVGAAHYLLDSNINFDDKGVWKGQASKAFIGHNRFATKGKINAENAHPFLHNTVVGAHNGTLTSVFRLEDGNKFDVDSEAIFYNLDKYDAKDTISRLQGAYALTWWDANDEHMYIIRNRERTLYWSRREDSDVIYWASEAWMLDFVLTRCGIKHTDPVAFEPDVMYRFDLSKFDRVEFRKRKWKITKNVFGYVPPKPTYHYYGNTGKDGGTSKSNPFPPSVVGGSTSYNTSSKAQPDYTKEEIDEMRALEDEVIEFKFGEVRLGQGRTPYISGFPADITKDWDIRIFSHKHKHHIKWASDNSKTVYTGKVKRFVQNYVKGKRECYVLLDLRTITEKPISQKEERPLVDRIPFDYTTNTPSDGMFYMGFGGNFLTFDEVMNCGSHGCAGCCSPLDPKDKYIFVDHNEFLCSDCMGQDFYKQFYPNILSEMSLQQLKGV